MSSEIPPTDYFTGISFNPDFYQSSSEEYLTASTAKSYFLSYPTAQGTETITTLKSSSIDSSSTTTNMAIASAQTSGALNIASLPSRTGNINIGYSTSAPSGLGYNINIGNILSNTSIGGKYIELAAASSGITISTSGTLDMIATAYNMGTSLLSATNINIGTVAKTTTTIFGTLTSNNATGDIYIGNGTNNTNAVNTVICSINKLQVGNTTTGNGIGTGTPYRCMIIVRNVGSTTAASGSITITGAPTGAGNPIVFASLNITTTSNPYFLTVNPTGTNTFDYYKTFYNRSGTTFSNAIVGATGETFNYVAIWL